MTVAKYITVDTRWVIFIIDAGFDVMYAQLHYSVLLNQIEYMKFVIVYRGSFYNYSVYFLFFSVLMLPLR